MTSSISTKNSETFPLQPPPPTYRSSLLIVQWMLQTRTEECGGLVVWHYDKRVKGMSSKEICSTPKVANQLLSGKSAIQWQICYGKASRLRRDCSVFMAKCTIQPMIAVFRKRQLMTFHIVYSYVVCNSVFRTFYRRWQFVTLSEYSGKRVCVLLL